MSNEPNQQPERHEREVYDDEIDLVELFRAIWAGKWWIGGTTVIAAVLAVLYALSLPNLYKAEALVAPVTDGGDGGLSAMARQYGGLASMAGVNLGGGEAGTREVALETLQSRRFLIDFISRHELKVPLLASEGWDERSREWVVDKDRYDVEQARWLGEDGNARDPEPTDWEAYKAFRDMLNVSEDRDSGMVTISIESRSPEAAQQWLEWLVRDINQFMQQRQRNKTQRNIAYLEEQLERTSVSGMRQVFYSLIEEQMKSLMLAELDGEYAFEVVDPPMVPEDRSAPSRSLIVILGVMLGGMLATFGVLVRYAFRSR